MYICAGKEFIARKCLSLIIPVVEMAEGNGMEESSSSVWDWRDESPSLIQSQRHVLQTGLYSDVVVKVGGPEEELISCHRFVLMSRSRVFATMLEERWRNS
jgi:hypothetical protein